MKIPTLNCAIGERLREIREAEGKTQEEIAALARHWGLQWTQGTVAAIEQARREISLQFELFPFLLALNRPLTDLLPASSSDRIEITSSADVPAAALSEILTARIDRPIRGCRLKARTAVFTVKTNPARLIVADALGVAEQKAAKRLNVEPLKIAKASRKLWGCSLPEERDRRLEGHGATPRSLQALRGHVTRELLEELRKVL